ncbi:MAG: methyltransferase domain-containing protein, partial [Treponema sp.]|nr:methyltransferase domain-containing protein [Treponema sp.]
MYQLKSVNVDDLWQKDQGWDAERKSGRKFDDRVELEFWDKLAPTYSRQYNLYRDSVSLRDKLKEIFGEGKKIIDLGCGSGNFSVPLSKYSKEILALDFSPAMLKQLAISIKQEGCKNIRMICSKWEDYTEDYQADFVLAVNSL